MKPAAVRHALQRDDINTYEEGVMAALQECEIDTTQRNVLVAHQFVTGADRSDSEETWVGGLDNVSAEVFKDFDYVALGHIHRPQKMGRETLRYSGTPLKYSFSEADHKKSVTIVELLEKGNVTVSTVPLIPRRDMRKLRGTYMDVTAKDHYTAENKMDYLQITLTDEEDVPGHFRSCVLFIPICCVWNMIINEHVRIGRFRQWKIRNRSQSWSCLRSFMNC